MNANSSMPGTMVNIGVRFSYPVCFSDHVFNCENSTLSDWLISRPQRPGRALVFLDEGLVRATPDLPARIRRYADAHSDSMTLVCEPVVMTGGETAKNSFDVPHKVIRMARKTCLCRHSLIVAVGGGAFLDAVGLGAALVHRGVGLVRVPTTVLSQNDSGVGVKNGVNLGGVKNLVGTFAPPAAVFNDFQFLLTLDRRDWVSGISEAFKVAIIKDRRFLDWLLAHAADLCSPGSQAMRYLVRRCAELHMEHISTSGDPFEFGSARPLDFGHWAAHKLESLSTYDLRHGEAVAVGMAIDLLYAAALGFIGDEDAATVIAAIERSGLPVWNDSLEMRDPQGRALVLNGIEEFREHLGGELHVTLPAPLGSRREVTSLDTQRLSLCIDRLKQMSEQCSRCG